MAMPLVQVVSCVFPDSSVKRFNEPLLGWSPTQGLALPEVILHLKFAGWAALMRIGVCEVRCEVSPLVAESLDESPTALPTVLGVSGLVRMCLRARERQALSPLINL
jgi:hypothetical protein